MPMRHADVRAAYPLKVFSLDHGLVWSYATQDGLPRFSPNAVIVTANPDDVYQGAQGLRLVNLPANRLRVKAAEAQQTMRMRYSVFRALMQAAVMGRKMGGAPGPYAFAHVFRFLQDLSRHWYRDDLESAADEFIRTCNITDLDTWRGDALTIYKALVRIGVLDHAREVRHDPTHPAKRPFVGA